MKKLPIGCNEKCRACAHRWMTHEESEKQKEAWLKQSLHQWSHLINPILSPAPEQRWGYRNKVSLAAQWNSSDWVFGMKVKDEIISLKECPIHSERVRLTLSWLEQYLPPLPLFPLSIYVQAGRQGTLILKTHETPDLNWLKYKQEALAQTGLEGLWLHMHPSAGRRLFGRGPWQLLWGKPRSYNELGLIYGPTAFQQLIPDLYARSLDEAEAFLSPKEKEGVIDLYCGSGASLKRWIGKGCHTVGVETSAEAIESAGSNAPGALLLRGTCSQRIPQLAQWIETIEGYERLAYLNPPRTGIESDVRQWLALNARPSRIAYLSCSAGTLGRDLLYMEKEGYKIKHITPYDFFPNTYHVETLACLSLK
ncbi:MULTISPECIES: class I SAM-dependent RNA methyltransferase [Aminobacterium]|jgi:23S rRNA (uracil1939-C5)-methyltransferase|uniref:class I SAM-dependent RNA methyltransferase n=1 Tax=Aminobacterium TaxID=81466 RepID=UPI0016BAFD42|nr:class I SAM-dependent RNA methyltransferase [Aminobacterium sp. EBM-42]MDD2379220.1 class I SAM-dependent RNA methyltransferase [Aminobacterium colombiense]MDD3768628.1 class I SAM-dependent RNA methyltransferase [Aminobacterium colombiense]MDD4265531.1 class I SAM-dependent RNA methyltransferase [Aminobacterium colombiense]NLK30377.1 class I SAM-dependent RNA methyltransferase [Aminobacterium colombiense]